MQRAAPSTADTQILGSHAIVLGLRVLYEVAYAVRSGVCVEEVGRPGVDELLMHNPVTLRLAGNRKRWTTDEVVPVVSSSDEAVFR